MSSEISCCPGCGKSFKRLATHLSRSAECKDAYLKKKIEVAEVVGVGISAGAGGGTGAAENNIVASSSSDDEIIEPVNIGPLPGDKLSGRCRDCGCKTTNLFEPFDILICRGCRANADDCKLITKTTAKKRYGLTDKELEQFVSICIENKMFRSGPPVQLFSEHQVAEWARENAGMIATRRQKGEKASKTRKTNYEEGRERRLAELGQELSKLGLVRRSDSDLCDKWEEGKLSENWTAKKVARRCAQMRFLYEHTRYSNELNEIIEGEKEYKGRFNYLECADSAEHRVLSDCGGWPEKWPWLEEAESS